MQFRANYARPAANSNITYGAQTAYFVNDEGFSDQRGGVTTWTRTWSTVPATWYEDSQYAFAFPAYAASAIGNIASVTAISANRTAFPWQYTLAAAATGLAAADTAFVDVGYTQGTQANIHVSVAAQIVSANATHVIIGSALGAYLYDNGSAFTGVVGTIRKMSAYRATPGDAEPVDAIITHDYAVSDSQNIANVLPIVAKFSPIIAANGQKTDTLSAATLPASATYASMVAAGTLIVAEPSTRDIYAGNIYERRTITVRAK